MGRDWREQLVAREHEKRAETEAVRCGRCEPALARSLIASAPPHELFGLGLGLGLGLESGLSLVASAPPHSL